MQYHFYLEPDNSRQLSNFCGELNANIKQIGDYFNIKIINRGNYFQIETRLIAERYKKMSSHYLSDIAHSIKTLYQHTSVNQHLTADQLQLKLLELPMQGDPQPISDLDSDVDSDIDNRAIDDNPAGDNLSSIDQAPITIKTRKAIIRPRGKNQLAYLANIRNSDISFGIGPAGTGKTFLAVACAVEAMLNDQVERILLVRPAVEAGEKLGFLPGDLAQKIDPYLRPLYDALYFLLGTEFTEKLIESNKIEIAPLAYMRGRTLSNVYVIFDESQNSTREQMKMLLTRIGFGSKVIVTGDQSQIDLANKKSSGLLHVQHLLKNVKGVSLNYFSTKDVVRHPVIQRIIDAYDSELIDEQST